MKPQGRHAAHLAVWMAAGPYFELEDELRDLRRDLEFTSDDRAAKTLAKTDGLRVTPVLLKRNASLHPEAAAGGATLHVLEGQIRVQTDGDHWNVGPAGVIVLGEKLRQTRDGAGRSGLSRNSGLACRRRRIAAGSRSSGT